MKLDKPIVWIDIETTGLSLIEDRIIEIAMTKTYSNHDILYINPKESFYTRINPEGREIRPESFAKHGIKIEDLENEPTFKSIAQKIFDFMKDCDIGGFNCKSFDIVILVEEFLRAGIAINVKSFKIVDVYKILTKAEPRTLESTYKRFVGKELTNGHSAQVDIAATIELFVKLKEIYDLPETTEELDKYAFDENIVDLENKLKKQDNNIVFNFGKYKDKTIQEVFKTDPHYYSWIIDKAEMTLYTKAIFRNILKYLIKQNS